MEDIKESFHYSPHYGSNIKAFLKQYDSSHSGYLCKENFVAAMDAIHASLSEDDINVCVAFLDTNQSGNIDCNEFVYVYHHRQGLHKNVRIKDPDLVTAHPLSPEGHKKGSHRHRQEMMRTLTRHRQHLESKYLDR